MKIRMGVFALFLGVFLFKPGPVLAQECTTQYGGTTTCTSTTINVYKEVANPTTGVFFENLGSETPFSGNQDVLFRLKIKNTGTQNFQTVTVKDIFPNELTFVSGPGTFDKGNNTLTFTLDNLAAGETQSQEILARIDPNKVNKDRTISCVINTARAWASPPTGGSDQDTAQLCIQTNVLGATTLPVAGFNDYALLLPFTLLGLTGMALLIKRA